MKKHQNHPAACSTNDLIAPTTSSSHPTMPLDGVFGPPSNITAIVAVSPHQGSLRRQNENGWMPRG